MIFNKQFKLIFTYRQKTFLKIQSPGDRITIMPKNLTNLKFSIKKAYQI